MLWCFRQIRLNYLRRERFMFQFWSSVLYVKRFCPLEPIRCPFDWYYIVSATTGCPRESRAHFPAWWLCPLMRRCSSRRAWFLRLGLCKHHQSLAGIYHCWRFGLLVLCGEFRCLGQGCWCVLWCVFFSRLLSTFYCTCVTSPSCVCCVWSLFLPLTRLWVPRRDDRVVVGWVELKFRKRITDINDGE